jgi:transcription elongation regulator 1
MQNLLTFTPLCPQVYYYNTLSHESSWEKPASFAGDEAKVAEQPRPVASVVVAGTDWSEVKCHDGRIYYFNTASEESSWTVPAEVSAAPGADD